MFEVPETLIIKIKEQEKLKSPAKIILQINTENEINNTSREISRDY